MESFTLRKAKLVAVNFRPRWSVLAARVIFTISIASLSAGAVAQASGNPSGVLHLSASATVEVPKDLLTVVFSTQKEGSDAAAVQAQLKQALDAALAEARKAARPGQLDVQTGGFGLHPRYAPKGGLSGWVGQAELLVEGRDAAAVAALVGRIATLSVSRVAWGLSREAREKAEGELSAQAIARWRQKADTHARQFGHAGYQVREVTVSGGDAPTGLPMPMVRGAAMAMASSDALPVEGGKAQVSITVSGSVQLK